MRSPRRRAHGFSFIEILVVMGIIAVLVGIGIGVYSLVIRKTPELKAKSLVQKVANGVEAWKRQYKAYPPTTFEKIRLVTGLGIQVTGRTNATNVGIEVLYQCLYLKGVDFDPDIADVERANLDDEDKLEKPITRDDNAFLFEIVDPWGNPLVYFVEGDYATAEKSPPVYVMGEEAPERGAQPKPWRSSTGGFAKPGSFQLFSMGPDGVPNTDDDLKAWE
jgi:prepilin-type N-terminal cleavage/methylation domain-containing protein